MWTICLIFQGHVASDDSDIRLKYFPKVGEAVEIKKNGEWHLVCYSDIVWDKRAAKVACRQLGYRGGWPQALPSHSLHFNDTQMFLKKVICSGGKVEAHTFFFSLSFNNTDLNFDNKMIV